MPFSRFKYSGANPGADSNVYLLFSTASAPLQMPANFFALSDIHRFCVDIKTANADGGYTLNTYKSPDRGVTWHQVTTEAVAAPAATATIFRDYVVEEFADWKLELVNNGTAKTVFAVDMAMTDERSATT